MDSIFPRITQDGRDGDEDPGYIENLQDGANAGFKYFDCHGIKRVSLKVRGYCFHVKLKWDGVSIGSIPVDYSNVWKVYSAGIVIPDGVWALYFEYRGEGSASLASFQLE